MPAGRWARRAPARPACEVLEDRRLFATIPAFPGAEGAGAYAAGGRGGDVYHVTNTNSTGTGSLANGIATIPASGRTIVFDVGGYIQLPETLRVTSSKLTIAGQTAPGDGVGFRNGTFRVSGDDVVVRNVRFYDDRGGDAVNLDSGSMNSIFDHVTVAFGNDENLSTWSPPENFTFQNSINAWGLVSHSAGGLWNTNHATAHHSLWIHNHTRSPKARPEEVLDWVNNVTADWDIGFIMGDSETPANWKANVIGNYFVSSYAKTVALEKAQLDRNGNPNFNLHMAGNALDGNANGVLDVTRTGYSMASGSYAPSATPFPNTGVPVTVDDYLTAYKKVVSTAGPVRLDADAKPLRDELNRIAVNDLVTQARRQVRRVSETGATNGGYGVLDSAPAATDTDRDGMPDYWETAVGLNRAVADNNVALPSSGGIVSANTFMPGGTPAGYTNFEEYLHFLSIPHGTVARNSTTAPTSIDIDLRKYTSGFTNTPAFTLSGVTNGAATLQPDGHTVRFVPTTNFFGRSKFNFTVTDADSGAWTQQFGLLVSSAGLPRNLGWQGGTASNAWDTTAANFVKDGLPPATAFSPGDSVTFDETGSNSPSVNVTGGQDIGGVTVNATKDYTIAGAGSLAGPGGLSKSGTGGLTVATANSYAGGTVLNQGTLTLNSATAAGSGPITLNGGSLTLVSGGSTTFANAINAEGTATLNAGGNLNVIGGPWTGGGTVNAGINGSNTFSLNGTMNGFSGTLALGGSTGNLRFNGSTTSNVNLGSTAATFDLGTGSADLLNRNGGITIDLGALRGGSNTALAGAGSVNAATTYSIGANGQGTTFTGAISNGSGGAAATTAITKTGSGTLTLAGTSGYTGATLVSAGTLLANGTLGNTAVTVAPGAALGGTGHIGTTTGGAVTVQGGATVTPGAAPGAGGILAVGNGLTLGSGSTLALDLTSSPAGANDKVTLNGGTMSLTGAINFQINFVDGFLNPGTYMLVEGGAVTAASGVTLNYTLPVGTRQTFTLQRTAAGSGAAFIRLVVTGNPASLKWAGVPGAATWDLNPSTSWRNGAASDRFFNLDAVTFEGGSAVASVSVAGSVQPRSILVDSDSSAYAFTGAGTIDGKGSLTKVGTAPLTISNTNGYTGGTTVTGGAITLGSAAANGAGLGAGPVTLDAATLNLFSAGLGTHAGTLPNALEVDTSATLNAAPRGGIAGPLTGAGTLNLHVPYVRNDVSGDWSQFTGRVNVTTDADGGDFRVATDYANPGFAKAAIYLSDKVSAYFTGIVAAGDGTIIDIGELAGIASSVLLGGPTGGRSFTWRVGARDSDAAFAGTIREQNDGSVTSLVKTGAGVWTLSGSADYHGGTVIEEGRLKLTGSLTSSGGQFEVLSGATLELDQGTVTADAVHVAAGGTLMGRGTIDGDVVNDGTVTAGGAGGDSLTITGSEAQNNGTIVVVAGGALVFDGVNNGTIDARNGRVTFGANFVNSGTVLLPPTTVNPVTVNTGAAPPQRSRITSLIVSFSQPVFLDAGAITVIGRGGAGAGTVVAVVPQASAGELFDSYTLTFSGPGVVAGSLPDGIYDLTVSAAGVHAAWPAGPTLAANFSFAFHRLYSDVDGDGDSDNADLFQMRSTYNKFSNDPASKWYFDQDGDGDVDNADVFQIRSRRTLTFQGY